MFRNKALNLTIIFSTAWHLFWISAVNIVVTPSVQSSNVHQEVDFLGPILEKTAFDLMVEEVKPQVETHYAKANIFMYDVYLKPKGPQRKILENPVPDSVFDERFGFSMRDYARSTKDLPASMDENVKIIYTKERKSLPFVEGPAAEREIIFRPEALTVPRGLYGDQKEYAVRLKFFVSQNGLVHSVEPVLSSGYAGIDLEATRSLRKWRFSPFHLDEEKEDDWGAVTVKVTAK